MKTIELRRHALKDEGSRSAMASPAGLVLARKVAEATIRGMTYHHAYVSEHARTMETLAAFIEGAGLVLPVTPSVRNLTGVPFQRWHIHTGGVNNSLSYLREHTPAFVEELCGVFREVFGEILVELAPGEQALVVGHMPAIPIIAFALSGNASCDEVAECEGVRLVFDDAGTCVSVEKLPIPDDLQP